MRKMILMLLTLLITSCFKEYNYKNVFEEYNKQLLERSDYLFNLNCTNIKKEEIEKSIKKYKISDDWNISVEEKNYILDNRNTNYITENIKTGIISKRGDLKGFPTVKKMFSENNSICDRNQESELHIGMPVLILHESLDKNWVYIRCYNYEGWTLKENVMELDFSTYQNFLNPDKFIIITEPLFDTGKNYLDMSVKLPLVSENNDNFEVLMPLEKQISKVAIPKKIGHKGYLSYTMDNVVAQAKKYLGTKYSWGGAENGVDCSSYIGNIFRTFGFLFPRNTKDQRDVIGNKIDTSNFTEIEKREILNKTKYPTLIYTKTHVLLYLKTEGNNQYVIHASGNGGKVQINIINDVNGLNLYPEIISINEIKGLY